MFFTYIRNELSYFFQLEQKTNKIKWTQLILTIKLQLSTLL